MQIVGKSEKTTGAGTSFADSSRYVSLYRDPPQGEMTLEQFEGAAWDRLRLLQAIEQQASTKDGRGKVEQLAKNFPLKSEADLHRDTVAHYAMRLAYARPHDRHWFVKHESALLHMRLDQFEGNALGQFLVSQGLSFPALERDEFESLRDDLLALEASEGRNSENMVATDFFKLRFEEALDLVRNRSALLKRGYVYVHKRQLTLVVCARFRALLSEALAKTYLALPQLQQSNERLTPLLSALTRRVTDFDYRGLTLAPGERVKPADLDQLSAKAYPLCMKRLHQHLRANHHLKHTGRLQYGLFLKGIGLSMEDALDFWRAEFTRKISVKTFESNYSYNIRHSYGKEGKGTDYTPYACDKIIAFKVGSDEFHGCPFKLLDQKELQATLTTVLDKPGEIRAIVDLAKGPAQIACSKFFEATHPGATASLGVTEVTIKHPNNYFRLARTYAQQKEKEKAAGGGAPAPASLPGAAT